jgi:acetyltransferase-like isoleucine patch superfamily enzyme
MEIGRNCEFAHGCDFEAHGSGTLEIGEGTYFNRYCMISAHDSVKVGKLCFFGPGVRIFDNNHKFSKEQGVSSELSTAPIVIGNHCWIASNAIILKGTTIGDNCVIGAGCIVHGEIPDGTLLKYKQEQEIIPLK